MAGVVSAHSSASLCTGTMSYIASAPQVSVSHDNTTLRRSFGSAFGHRLFSYPLASAARLPFGAGRGPRPNAPCSPTATAYRHRPVWSLHPTTRLASHRAGRSFNRQRSRAGHPAHRKALCADGREPNTTAFQCALVSGISQLARRWCAMPSHHDSARLRIVLVSYSGQLWVAPATATRFAFT